MSLRPLPALLFVSLALCSAAGMAQTIYKCGNSYSQSPCPGAVAIDASDSRSPAQKAQADAATKRDAQAANTLEQARLKQEAKARGAAKTPVDKAAVTKARKDKPQAKRKEKRDQESGYFTAREPGSKKPARKDRQSAPASASPAVTEPSLKP